MKKMLTAFILLFLGLSVQSVRAVTVYYQPTPYPESVTTTMPSSAVHFWEGWLLTDQNWKPLLVDGVYLKQNDWLYVGGLNSKYRYLTYLQFDLTGLPQHVDLAYFWLAPGLTSSPYVSSPYAVCPNLGPWSPYSSWMAIPAIGECVCWYPAPTANSWAGFWASGSGAQDWYNKWQDGTLANNGIMIYSQNTTNGFNGFISSRYASPYDVARPILQLNFTPPVTVPNFKMPLPGGTSWLLTNEAGGYECTGSQPWPDTAHQGNNYFSVDIAPANHDTNGNTVYTGNIPVIAAAGGVVVSAGTDSSVPGNGYFVVVNHNNDITNSSGFSTRYLHLQNNLQVQAGNVVTQGQLLGYMGNTGASAVHLHFGMRYATGGVGSDGGSSSSMVQYATVEGWLMKSFQTECQNGTWIRYYQSTNTTYPHNN